MLGAVAVLAMSAAVWLIVRSRATPEKREKVRRLRLTASGRPHDGMVIDADEGTLYYVYTIRGVSYQASQDVSQLLDHLPDVPAKLVGPVTLRYSPTNPANSILVSEEWRGVRSRQEIEARAAGYGKPAVKAKDA